MRRPDSTAAQVGALRRARRAAVGTLLPLLVVAAGLGCAGQKSLKGNRYRTVQPGVAAAMMRDNPDLVVLDVRPFDEYSAPAGHLVRALSAPVTELEALWPDLGLTVDDTVLLYCGDGSRLQNEASSTLIAKGLRYVVQIEGGLEAWLADGFEVRVEDAPLSPARPQSPRATNR